MWIGLGPRLLKFSSQIKRGSVPKSSITLQPTNKMKLRTKGIYLALVAIITTAAHAEITGKSCGFMDRNQLAAWRAETMSKSIAAEKEAVQAAKQKARAAAPAFFTGKPYLPATATYAFKYRDFAPSLARWTSEDPSGFPDGANSSVYLNNRALQGIDPTGEKYVSVGSVCVDTFDIAISNWGIIGGSLGVVGGVLTGITPVGITVVGGGISTIAGSVSGKVNVSPPVISNEYAERPDSWIRLGIEVVKDKTRWTGIDSGFTTTTISFMHTVVVDFHWGPAEYA